MSRYYVAIGRSSTREVYGPYGLDSAKSFARIGSQTGRMRRIHRGSRSGPLIRRYEHGERKWPTLAHVKSVGFKKLTPAEVPREVKKALASGTQTKKQAKKLAGKKSMKTTRSVPTQAARFVVVDGQRTFYASAKTFARARDKMVQLTAAHPRKTFYVLDTK